MLSLALATTLLFFSLLIPGMLLNKSLTSNTARAFCLAPASSIAILCFLAIMYAQTGIKASYKTLTAGLILLALVAFLISLPFKLFKKTPREPIKKKELLGLFLFIAIVAFLAAHVFLVVLDGPDCYFQAWDNQSHLRRIRSFIETKNYSSFNSQSYLDSNLPPAASSPSFYPSAWHLLAAMMVSALNIPVTEAANAVNCLCVGLILPLTFFLILKELGITDPKKLAICAVICIGVPIFPWDLISYGPLYPNLLGFCLLPGEMALLLHLTDVNKEDRAANIIKNAILLLIGITALTFAHTNTVFSLGLMLAPCIVSALGQILNKKMPRAPKVCCYSIPFIAIAAIWIAVNRMPFLKGVVNCSWPAITSLGEAVGSALFLGTTTHPIQVLIPILTFIGICISIKSNRSNLVFTYFILLVFYVIDAGTNLPIKPYLTGFWYNDYHRISAMLGLTSILLASVAASTITSRIEQCMLAQKYSKAIKGATFASITIVIALLVFYPSVPFRKDKNIQTAFGYQTTEMQYQFDKNLIYYDVFSPLEEAFCTTTVKQLNPGNALIINNPDDGSLFAYSVYGINVYYRFWYPPSKHLETEESKLIRLHLDEVDHNEEVQQAVKKLGAKYVIQLDHGDASQEYRIVYNNDNQNKWQGIDRIDESTPGFTLIASYDDMRLYSIDLME